MESAIFSKSLAHIHNSTRHQSLEHRKDHQQNYEDLKSRLLEKINSLISKKPYEDGPLDVARKHAHFSCSSTPTVCPLELQNADSTRWRSCLRHCAISRKLAGSIPDGVTGIFHWHNPFGRTMALGSTQPLREMSNRNISWGKGGRCLGLTTILPWSANCLEIWEPQPPGNFWVCPSLWWDYFLQYWT